MPCNSDHPNPTGREQHLQRAAKLYKYYLKKRGIDPPFWLLAAVNDQYCRDDRAYLALCRSLTQLAVEGPELLKTIVYNPSNVEARDLANWWEDHLKADKARTDTEAATERTRQLRKQALDKLTAEEIKALGL